MKKHTDTLQFYMAKEDGMVAKTGPVLLEARTTLLTRVLMPMLSDMKEKVKLHKAVGQAQKQARDWGVVLHPALQERCKQALKGVLK